MKGQHISCFKFKVFRSWVIIELLLISSVLILAEIIILLTGIMFECFEFMTRITLIAHWCFSWRWAVFTQCQGHFSFCPASEELAVHNKLGEDTTRAADPSRQRNAPHHIASCLSIQLGGLAGKVATARGLGRHWSAGTKKLYYALFVLYILFYFFIIFFLFYSNPHYLNP